MNSLEDFMALVRTELGLPLTVEHARSGLHELPGWESIHLLWLVAALEERSGRSISVIDLLEAPNLEFIYGLAAAS